MDGPTHLMNLPDFIDGNLELILAEWVTFAETCGEAGGTMGVGALRDHAKQMLEVIAADLRTPQSKSEQHEKATGDVDAGQGGPETAAMEHGAGRAESGFTIGEMAAEYRALRASVTRLWTDTVGTLEADDLNDLVRFNEAIDQALAESVTHYTAHVDQSKEMFIAILGHDLRSPLSSMITTIQFLVEKGGLDSQDSMLAARLVATGLRMNDMIGDLLDFTRGRLGKGMPLTLKPMNMGEVAQRSVQEMQAANPKYSLNVTTTGDLYGEWDADRIGQLFNNLVGNAVHHGLVTEPVTVNVTGAGDDVVLSIHNGGVAIPDERMHDLFSPFRQSGSMRQRKSDTHLGLGLFIVEQIVAGHGGDIRVTSTTEKGTTFVVTLPRVHAERSDA